MNPDCPLYLEKENMEAYMEKIRDEIIESLSPIQLAALFQDFHEFCYRWREEQDIQRAESEMD